MEVDLESADINELHQKSMLKHSRPLEDLNIDVLQAIEYMLATAEDNGRTFVAKSAISTAFNITHSRTIGVAFDAPVNENEALNNLAVFGDVVMNPSSENYDVQALVAGLGAFRSAGIITGNVRDYLLDGTDHDREQAIILVTAAARIVDPFITINGTYYDDHRTISIASQQLAKFILSRPDDVEEIACIVNSRKTDNIHIIKDVLDHTSKSLSDGVL